MSRASFVTTGMLFSMLWASASVAGKFGLQSVEPLVLFNVRFLAAGTILLIFTAVMQERIAPAKGEWKDLAIFGLLNTTLYLGLFVVALQWITPGITTLAVAINPLLISIISAFALKRRVNASEWASLILGLIGLFIASYPQLDQQSASRLGMTILFLSMLSYSLGAVFYSSVPWKLSRLGINGWQALLGGLMLIPATILAHERTNSFDATFWISLSWLVLPVSIIAIQLWLRLLKTDAVKASLWLYLCPLFGFAYAAFFFDEPITWYTIVGTVLVLVALYMGQKKNKSS